MIVLFWFSCGDLFNIIFAGLSGLGVLSREFCLRGRLGVVLTQKRGERGVGAEEYYFIFLWSFNIFSLRTWRLSERICLRSKLGVVLTQRRGERGVGAEIFLSLREMVFRASGERLFRLIHRLGERLFRLIHRLGERLLRLFRSSYRARIFAL